MASAPLAHAKDAKDASGVGPLTSGPQKPRQNVVASAHPNDGRWLGATADATIEAQRSRALRPGAEEGAQAVALSVFGALADRAALGFAEHAARSIAEAAVSPDLHSDASLTARALASDDGAESAIASAQSLGILTDLALLGPFRDTGGGLDAHDGPEAASSQESPPRFSDMGADYSWGSIAVRWRTVAPAYAQAKGVPLDLFIAPRKESCSFVASKVTLDDDTSLVVRLASSGQARLMFDGVTVGVDQEVHEQARLDRLAAVVHAARGPHIVAAKVCSGALDDDGRVRLRMTDIHHRPLVVRASADLTLSSGQRAAWGNAANVLFDPQPTVLRRVLHADGSESGALHAASLRRLAGSDDLRSPRVAGLLDMLGQHDRDAERSALLGWLSPSGATRSGRLLRARQLAADSGDAPTLAFVDRRLIEMQLEADMPDWAIAHLRGTELRQATDPEAVTLRARTLRALHVDALDLQALRELRSVFRSQGATLPTATLLELGSLARSSDVSTWKAAADELAKRGVRGDSWVEASASQSSEAVVRAARVAWAGGVDSAEEALSVAKRVAEAGAIDVAHQLYTTLSTWAPNHPDVWLGLARTAGAGATQASALAAVRRARELAPGDGRTRAELALRAGKSKPLGEEGRDDERWLTKIETILARRQGVTEKGPPRVADRQLHWLRAVKMHPDHRVSQLIQYAREIVIAPRSQQELFEPIPPEGDLTEILRARVYRRSGEIAFPVEEHNDGARPQIRWPELEAGDTVEVVVRQWSAGAVGGRGDPPYFFLDYAGSPASHPLLYNEVVVETPPDMPLYVDVVHENLAPFTRTETTERGMHVLRMVWEKPLAVPEEPLAPQLTELAPLIVGSTFHTWNDFRRWYSDAVAGFTEPDEEMKRIARELTKGATSRQGKLRALFDFVADDIRYVNYMSGEWWLPNRPQQLLARREGDCDDKALLLITLLRAVGIEAQEVMVQTRMTGQPSVVLAKHAAVPLFDHGIAYLPGPGGGTYLDATSPGSRLGPIPSMDARAVALRMEGVDAIVQLPSSSAKEHGSDVHWTMRLANDGSAKVEGDERHSGDSAFWLRTNLSQAEARGQYVEAELVGPWLSSVEVDKSVAFEGDLPGGTARVRYRASSRAAARREGRDLVVSVSPSSTFGSSLAPLVERTQPVQLPSNLAPSHHTRSMRIVAPEGFAWGELPPGGDVDGGEFGRAHLAFVRDEGRRALVITREVWFEQDLIPVEKYADWRSFLGRVDALMHREVRLTGAPR